MILCFTTITHLLPSNFYIFQSIVRHPLDTLLILCTLFTFKASAVYKFCLKSYLRKSLDGFINFELSLNLK